MVKQSEIEDFDSKSKDYSFEDVKESVDPQESENGDINESWHGGEGMKLDLHDDVLGFAEQLHDDNKSRCVDLDDL